ncbi:hypothetical protein [Rugosimonospora africana]|uniref:DNRLRE domain-containing protein n=1 Tax=Rugosimonospora africana TaxID=556532 RepID=A0A8J3R2Q7_9ACTN|nr:hypothetical protein [Rugosimonospora africana]GIH20588.1 hypothetical protein Raf01_87600 [Rugosimonospora africana]
MDRGRRLVRLAAAGLASLTATGVLAVVTVTPASAGTIVTPRNSSWAYINSATQTTSHLNEAGDVPVGAVTGADGRQFKARAYFTFDISGLRGAQITTAGFSADETRADDCVDRAVELWETGPVSSATTWKNPAKERQRLGAVGYIAGTTCPSPYLEWDATAGLRDALASGETTLTLELRVPAKHEGDAKLGRWFANRVLLNISYNKAPNPPTKLRNGNGFGGAVTDCASQAPGPFLNTTNPTLYATLSDPDSSDQPSGELAIWPVDQPDNRTTFVMSGEPSGSVGQTRVPDGALVDGGSYAWQIRASDGSATSSWSDPCYFQLDTTAPAHAPSVSSPDYPSGIGSEGQGIPGTFVFTANDPDVVGFAYEWYGYAPGYVAADALGGTATVSSAPPQSSVDNLEVTAIDRAGWRSPTTDYRFDVSTTWPTVSYTGTPAFGTPFAVTFAPGVTDRPGYLPVSYTYQINDGQPQTVVAAADGTASTQITFATPGFAQLSVTSKGSNGWVSPANQSLFYLDTTPTVSSADYPESGDAGGAGVSGSFTFTAKMPGSTQFAYSFDSEATTQTAPVGQGGTATIDWTPTAAGWYELDVWTVTADGTASDPYYYFFTVG